MQKTVQFKDVSLYTESFGDMKNPTILLIMGSASSLIWWDEVFCQKLVDKGFFVIRYDHRDTGKSTHYPVGKPGYSLETLSDDAIEILNAYQIDKGIVMGMSMGGMLAQMVAVRHPNRVSGLVLLASIYGAEGGLRRLPGPHGGTPAGASTANDVLAARCLRLGARLCRLRLGSTTMGATDSHQVIRFQGSDFRAQGRAPPGKSRKSSSDW